MKSSANYTLKNGTTPRTGRDEPNRIRKELARLQEENFKSLYQLQYDMANNHPDHETRMKCQQFLLDKVMPKATPAPAASYVKFDLIPMHSMEDITENELKVLELIAKEEVSLEEGQKFLSLTAQARSTYEATEAMKLIESIDGRLKENGM